MTVAKIQNKPRWCIVGGGFLGAILAAKLNERGYPVHLVEAAHHIGGLADGWQVGTLHWDRFYHVILLSDMRTRSLLAELGLEQDIQWRETRTGFYTDGKLYSMSNSMEFLRFPPLGLIDKFRLAATIVLASRTKNWQHLESIDALSWLQRWSGERTVNKIWKPLLRAKLGELYKATSAAFIWSTINRMYAARRSGLKKEMFGYVKGGYQRVADTMYAHLDKLGVQVSLGTTVNELFRENGAFAINANRGAETIQIQCDKVIVATPAPIAASICRDLPQQDRDHLTGITHLGVICVSVVLNRPLAGYYVTNVTDDWVPFTGVIEMSALVDAEVLGGRGFIYLPKYLPSDSPEFARSDAHFKDEFVAALVKMYPRLSGDDILDAKVARARHVMAVPTLHFSSKIPPVKSAVEGLYTVNAAQILFGTLNINEIGLLADRAFAEIDA